MKQEKHLCEFCKEHKNCGWEHKYMSEEKHDCYRFEWKYENANYEYVLDKFFELDVMMRHFCINYREKNTNGVYACEKCPLYSYGVGCLHTGIHNISSFHRELFDEIDRREEEYADKQGWTGDE
jgi:hypothetical protein